jgi:hypothetical protein
MVLLMALQGVRVRNLFQTVALFAVMAAGAPTLVHAQPAPSAEDVEEAKARFAAGNAAFSKGQYREAVSEFQGGYMLTRSPGFLLNIGVCYRKLGETKQALENFKDYLKAEPQSPRRAEVEKQISELEAAHGPAVKTDVQTNPVRLADGSLDPAAVPIAPAAPVATKVEEATPPAKPTRTPVPLPTSGGAQVVDASEDDGVSLVVTGRRSGAASAVPVRAARKAAPKHEDEPESSNHMWLWLAIGGAVVAGVAVAFATTGGKSETGTLGSVDLR